jgi:hypothetical protein
MARIQCSLASKHAVNGRPRAGREPFKLADGVLADEIIYQRGRPLHDKPLHARWK